MLIGPVPLLGVQIAMVLLDEHLSGWQWLGAAMPLAGLVLFEKVSVEE
jgi:drug/metabolite transporter (DMT)-like permease